MHGNVYDYYQTVMAIIARVREGDTVRQACILHGLPRSTFLKYVLSDATLTQMLGEAEADSYDAMAEMLVNIDSVTTDSKLAAVISKNVQWLLDKRAREKYGTKVKIERDEAPDKLIIEALQAAIARIPMPNHPAISRDHPIIDVTPEPVVTLDDVL